MIGFSSVFAYFLRPDVLLYVLLGAAAGVLVGAIPGLSVNFFSGM